jgi:hypothetical protein
LDSAVRARSWPLTRSGHAFSQAWPGNALKNARFHPLEADETAREFSGSAKKANVC